VLAEFSDTPRVELLQPAVQRTVADWQFSW
jgi:hypothetical protein